MKNTGINIFRMFLKAGAASLGGMITAMMLLRAEYSGGLVRCAHINNKDSVAWRMVPPDDQMIGAYNLKTDSIYIMKLSDNVMSHELKHAHNAVVFTKYINLHADEIAARCAEFLTERETKTIGTELSKFKFVNGENNMLLRNVDYIIPDIDQQTIDWGLLNALVDWEHTKGVYKRQRIASFFLCSCDVMSDADLEKLFTFQINGVPRSLFAECSPELRECLRDACNAGSVAYNLKHKLGRGR